MTRPSPNPAAPAPKPRDWRNAQITIPDWLVAGMLVGLLCWFCGWASGMWPRKPVYLSEDGFYHCHSSTKGVIVITITLGVTGVIGFWYFIHTLFSPKTANSLTLSYLLTLRWVHTFAQFNIPLARLDDSQSHPISGVPRYLSLVRDGDSPGQAVIKTISGLPGRIKQFISAAESLGCLADGLGCVIKRLEARAREAVIMPLGSIAMGSLILATCLIPAFIFVLLPQYLRLFSDSMDQLSLLSRCALGFCQWFALGGTAIGLPDFFPLSVPGFAWVFIFLFILLLGIDYFITLFQYVCRLPLFLKTPWLGPIAADNDWSDVYALLALATGHGIPLPQAIKAAQLPTLNTGIKSRLIAWHNHLQAGQAPAEAALSANMPPRLVAALNIASTNAGLTQSLAQLAHFHESRASWQTRKLAPLLPPMLTLLSGLVVGLVVLGLADAGRSICMHIQNHWH